MKSESWEWLLTGEKGIQNQENIYRARQEKDRRTLCSRVNFLQVTQVT